MKYWLRLGMLLALLLIACTPLHRAQAQSQLRQFPETGYSVGGPFLSYWERSGGLAVFGYPVSPELWENGRVVQYFERNRFELHPDKAVPFNVLLGLLGEERLRSQGRSWRTLAVAPATLPGDCLRFAETSHALCGEFRQFWERSGGLAVFGFPLTEPFAEVSETDGQTYTVQYFERNRFELHPENPAAFRVLLGLLGRWRVENLLGGQRQPSPIQATIAGPEQLQAPLTDLTLAIRAGDYSGPAELRLFDGAGRREGAQALTLTDGQASTIWRAQGALGDHSAVLLIAGAVAGIESRAYTLDAQTSVQTGLPQLDALPGRVADFLANDVSEYDYAGYHVRGYRSPDSYLLWLRDHVHQGLGYRFFDPDMTSLLDYFRREQKPGGAFDDYFAVVNNDVIQGRTDVEADLEYLFVQGVYQAWQATGDDAWLRASLPAMEQGIAYSTSDPWRWNPDLQLIRRPYTIDTWDFEYGGPTISPDGKPAPRHWIDAETRFGVMHGDNTGMAFAMRLMSRIYSHFGDWTTAADWQQRSDTLKTRLDAVAWNGRFYTHNVLEQPFDVPGVDEAQQLSLSNAYALNRNVLSPEQARSIIDTYYQRRQANPDSLQSEWYSIDPPFPADSFGTLPGWGQQPGEYVNGGKMPLVGGELARGAFSWGSEVYGFDILRRYAQLINDQNGTYLWYYPAGNPGISSAQTLPTDGWGSAAMLAALIEGAAGVTDNASLYQDVTLAPRWSAAPDVQEARVVARYAASLGYVAYHWQRQTDGINLEWTGGGERVLLRVLLPANAPDGVQFSINGAPSQARISWIGPSRYVEALVVASSGSLTLRW